MRAPATNFGGRAVPAPEPAARRAEPSRYAGPRTVPAALRQILAALADHGAVLPRADRQQQILRRALDDPVLGAARRGDVRRVDPAQPGKERAALLVDALPEALLAALDEGRRLVLGDVHLPRRRAEGRRPLLRRVAVDVR